MRVHQIIGTVNTCNVSKFDFEQRKLETVFESVELYRKIELCEIWTIVWRRPEAKTSPESLWHIFVNFMEKESCTKFCNALVRFNKAIKLQSFELSVRDVIPANVRTFFTNLWNLFKIFINDLIFFIKQANLHNYAGDNTWS